MGWRAPGGRSPIILEGVTEYLTREISVSIKTDRATQKKYDSQLIDVTTKAGGVSAKTFEMFKKLALGGDLSEIPTLGGVVPRL